MSEQAKALELAEQADIEREALVARFGGEFSLLVDVADELRLLHSVNAELLEALQGLIDAHAVPSSACKERPAYDAARAAVARALGQSKGE